jgi:MoxR-like ATPase
MIVNNLSFNDAADWWPNFVLVDVMPAIPDEDGNIARRPKYDYKQYLDGKKVELEFYEHWKRNNEFDGGIIAICGRMYRYLKEIYFIAIDLDNEAAIKAFCAIWGKTLQELADTGEFLIDQTADKTRAHVYFHATKRFKFLDKSAYKDVEDPNIPIIEVKRTITVAPSPHYNGSTRQLLNDEKSVRKFVNDLTCLDKLEKHIDTILKKYGVEYLNGKAKGKASKKANVINLEEKWREGERNIRVFDYTLDTLRKIGNTTPHEIIKRMVFDVNQARCEPPLRDAEVEQIWQSAQKYVTARNRDNSYSNADADVDANQGQPISVLAAKRLHKGKMTVIGTIVSVSQMYVLPENRKQNDIVITINRNAKSIQLEDSEKLDENERLDCLLFDDMVENVHAGELVEVCGTMYLADKKSSNKKSKKKINVLHAESIKYLNRKEFVITEKDIKAFEKFAVNCPYQTCKWNLMKRLTILFAPHIIGHEDIKRGLLRAIVGGIDRGKISSGRLDTLLAGDPGTAKSELGFESADVKPNSRHVSAPHATAKTITAIAEKINEMATLLLGAIPLSRGGICAIDEINAFPIEDQGRLLDIMQTGFFDFDKMGIRTRIPAPTTIIATANPIGGNWNSPEVATKEELQLKMSLLDRFTQIYTLRDSMNEKQIEEFVKQISKISQRRPHNYNFLKKYLIYASSIKNVVFTKEARYELDKFWSEAKLKGLLSIRMYFGMFKIAEACAKLELKSVVDVDIANEVIEDMRLIMVHYGETVGKITGPKETTIKACQDILKKTQSGMTIEAMCEIAVKEDEQIASYLGYIWTLEGNGKLKEIVKSLYNHPCIKKVGSKPIILKWIEQQKPILSDVSDVSDVKTEKNVKKIDSNITSDMLEKDDRKLKNASDRSDTSDSYIEIKSNNIDLNQKPNPNPEKTRCLICGEVDYSYYTSRHKHESSQQRQLCKIASNQFHSAKN